MQVVINFILIATLSLFFTTTVNAQTCNLENDGIEDCNESDCKTNKIFNQADSQGNIIFCQNNKKVVCPSSYTEVTYDSEGNASENVVSFESYKNDPYAYFNLANSQLTAPYCDTYTNYRNQTGNFEPPRVGRVVVRNEALGYTGILQRVSQLLYAVAIFLFVFLMIINGIHLVRSGNSPEELKKAKEGIFKTIAGFLFVLFSGGFIISIINSMQQ